MNVTLILSLYETHVFLSRKKNENHNNDKWVQPDR
jgi:hypothetical protein